MQMRAGVAKKTIRSVRQQAFEATHLFDSHPESSLDFEKVRAAVKDGYNRPFLLIDSTIVREKTRRFTAAMPRVLPHYAVKANPDPRILKLMLEQGAAFEIASIAELDLLLALGVSAADVYYSNPVKSRDQIAHAASRGVLWYVIDSVEELKKIQSIKADARLYLRIDTPNIGSDWPLAGKFGAHASEVRDIVVTAARLKVDLAGVAFHVGSQCRNPENWRVGIEKSRAVFDQMQKAGLNPRLLNIGGGFPVRHVKPIPAIEVIGEAGRFLVSDAGYFVCRIMGTATRANKRWMHLDAGLFGGIIETAEGLKYKVRTDRAGPDVPWNVAGPTCDSIDVVMRDEPLPSDLQEGDYIYLRNAGAYTTAYASNFNGFPLPEIRVI